VPEPDGLVAVILVADTTTTLLACADPNLTVAPRMKPVPVMVTRVPPAAGPWAGETPVTEAGVAGCQFGISFPRVPVSTVAGPPAAGITSIVCPAGVARANRIRWPSGDHDGWYSAAESVVRRRTLPFATVSTQTSNEPERVLANAMDAPSGDHAGCTLREVPDVSGVTVPPAAGTTQI
jgi:hypothetical protein